MTSQHDAGEAGSEWRDISTAPKDGTQVLLADDGGLVIAAYVAFSGTPPEGYHNGWFELETGFREINPTHWMPLPESPEPSR